MCALRRIETTTSVWGQTETFQFKTQPCAAKLSCTSISTSTSASARRRCGTAAQATFFQDYKQQSCCRITGSSRVQPPWHQCMMAQDHTHPLLVLVYATAGDASVAPSDKWCAFCDAFLFRPGRGRPCTCLHAGPGWRHACMPHHTMQGHSQAHPHHQYYGELV